MVYSCATFEPGDSLAIAQERKIELVLRKVQARPGDRLLDIGCGWGTLAKRAHELGLRVVGVTVSDEQARYARERTPAEIRARDYREINDGPYDAITSVGMVEHIGREQLAVYFQMIAELLRPGGRALVHGITKRRPSRRSLFIQRFIFPDGELVPLATLIDKATRAGLRVAHCEDIGEHYPPTLRAWLRNLEQHEREAVDVVGAERFRAWCVYLAASALAFERGDLGVHQLVLAKDATHLRGVVA
jgi:cyclopropane-fatty-acyl-phospholipid synthase